MMDFTIDINTLLQLMTIALATGILYNKLTNIETKQSQHGRTLYGENNDNGLVGDMLIMKEHIKHWIGEHNHG